MLGANDAFDHELPVGCEEVNVTLPPAQNDNGPFALIVGAAGIGFTTMCTVSDGSEIQPFASVCVTA
jgi:hypothetical protein